MKYKILGAAAALATLLAGCQTTGADMTIADYCADPENAAQHVCEINADVTGNTEKLTSIQSDLNATEQKASSALESANSASAEATEAANMARSALTGQTTGLSCKTLTVQKAQSGSCEPGYTLTGCVQTRYTTAAGGLSILREINDTSCRFNTRVLEMQLRCCTMARPAQVASVN